MLLIKKYAQMAVLAGAASMFLGTACASADHDRQAASDRETSRPQTARQIDVGQGRYMIPAESFVAERESAPYSLTGDSRTNSERSTQRTGRLIQTGQGWTYVPAP